MLERQPKTRRNLILLGLFALLLWFLWSIRQVVNPLVIGYLLAFILHPVVQRVREMGFSKRTSVLTIFALGFTVIGGTLAGLVVQTRRLARDVAHDPAIRARLEERLELTREKIGSWLGEEWVPDFDIAWLVERARAFVSEHGETVKAAGKASLSAAGETIELLGGFLAALFGVVGALFLIPLYTYFLLFELERIHTFAKRHLPVKDRDQLAHVAEQIGGVISNFFRGRLSVCLLKGVFLTLGLWLAGVNYAFLFGMTSGFLSLIPFFGPFLGFAGALAIGGLEFGVVQALLRTGVVFGLGELLEGYVLIPKILGDSLGLHEVVVLFALLAGGAAFGMLGVLISLPVAASLLIVFRELVLPALQRSVDEGVETG